MQDIPAYGTKTIITKKIGITSKIQLESTKLFYGTFFDGQCALNTQFLPRPARTELNVSKLTIPSWQFLAGVKSTVHVSLPKRSINQFNPVLQSRQEVLIAYCSNTNTVPKSQSH